MSSVPSGSPFVAPVVSMPVPGQHFRVQASAETLRRQLTDSYWCHAMEEVCDGKLEGILVRYTGDTLALMQFRPERLSAAGYRYPLSMSIPVQYLVPVQLRARPYGNSVFGSTYAAGTSSAASGAGSAPGAKDPMAASGRGNNGGLGSRAGSFHGSTSSSPAAAAAPDRGSAFGPFVAVGGSPGTVGQEGPTFPPHPSAAGGGLRVVSTSPTLLTPGTGASPGMPAQSPALPSPSLMHPPTAAAVAAKEVPRLCVVCGRYDLPGEVRKNGYKCTGCIGTKSVPRLLDCQRKRDAMAG